MFALLLVGVTTLRPGAEAQEAAGRSPSSERVGAARRAADVVARYLAAETADAAERVAIRRALLEFGFRVTDKAGRRRGLSEGAWLRWEGERAAACEVRELAVLGEPHAEMIRESLYQIDCAVRLAQVEDGERWEGVSLRRFEVRIDSAGKARIRHERELARREGKHPGRWKRFRKTANGSRSNLRSSPTTARDNVIGKVESGEAVEVWEQDGEQWLLVRATGGQAGFMHRSQIDLGTPLPPAPHERNGNLGAATVIAGPEEQYPFAAPLPGKPGYVLHPYRNTIVDVRELPPGTVVRDPGTDRAFRVPAADAAPRDASMDEE